MEKKSDQPKGLLGSGLSALVMIAQAMRISVDIPALLRRFGPADRLVTPQSMVLALKWVGLKAKMVSVKFRRLAAMPFPVLVQMKDEHWGIVWAHGEDGLGFLVTMPGEHRPQSMSAEELWGKMSGIAVFQTAAEVFKDRLVGARWFLAEMARYKWLFVEAAGMSFCATVLGLATALYFQLIMDKVLVHGSSSTLETLTYAVVAAILLEHYLKASRGVVLQETTNKVDVHLGTQLFRHMLSLPLSYYEASRVGANAARVQALDTVRHFMSTTLLTAFLDLIFVVVYLAVLAYYSMTLTGIVCLSFLFYAVVAWTVGPPLRMLLEEKFRRGANNHAFLVETIGKIFSVKANTGEHEKNTAWGGALARYVKVSAKAAMLAIFGAEAISLIQALTTVTVLVFGVELVHEGELTVGQLVAFNIISGRIAAPVIRFSQVWQELQQVRVALKMVNGLLKVEPESSTSLATPGKMVGEIKFEGVSFRYPGTDFNVLEDVSFTVSPGQRVGIVGESGSGKSTLMRLLMRYNNLTSGQGRAMIDGHDVSTLSLEWLRSQMGVVPQDAELFTGTILDNITFGRPDIPFEEISAAAKLSGADGFILNETADGYATELYEGGKNLSGGQRQRIVITRALVRNPPVLLLDEATSALDVNSEKGILQNLDTIGKDRTMLIISHRLSMVRDCDQILVMSKGRIVERGTHEELMAIENGHYAQMHAEQFA